MWCKRAKRVRFAYDDNFEFNFDSIKAFSKLPYDAVFTEID